MKILARKDLDSKAVEIEFLLISVVQGLAIQVLAVEAVDPLIHFEMEYWPYIVSAFSLIMFFWSQSILHTLSFIEWPIDLVHTFLYFLASFFEVIAFNQIRSPFSWFGTGLAFLAVATVLYIYDLAMIRRSRKHYSYSKGERMLYEHMYTRQKKEMVMFLPAAIGFNVLAVLCVYGFPELMIERHYHVLFGVTQSALSLGLLISAIKTFKERQKLIENSLSS